MELLYNPDVMPAAEVKATFVGRQWLVDELVSLVQRQPDGAGIQHVVIIAPRGMGKTTVLLMIEFAIREGPAASQWQAVRFSEESYDVTDLADFWMKTLSHLAADTQDPELLKRVDRLKAEHPGSDDLEEAGLALIKDWRREHGKRLVLLVDNFDLILAQINDERDNARLRNVLMNDGTLMLMGAATSFFREARAYDQPLYNFFKFYNLEALRSPEIEELLRKRAAVDGQPQFEDTLTANSSRLRALEYFTGGSPRLVLMLYRVVARSELIEVRHGLEKLLDEVTPYFKGKIEGLPAQQRKILDHIARLSSQTREGQTPTAIAQATRMPPNQVSAQLRRLHEEGYVRAANLRGRNSYYTLSEPLFAIWYQMRFGREARQRMQWLVDFLRAWYDAQEILTESQRLETRFRELLTGGSSREAQEALEYRRYLVEAMTDPLARLRAMDSVIRSYLELGDSKTLTDELLSGVSIESLPTDTLQALHEARCLSDEQFRRVQATGPTSAELQTLSKAAGTLNLCASAVDARRWDEALQHLGELVEIMPDNRTLLLMRGLLLSFAKGDQQSDATVDRALEIEPTNLVDWALRGAVLLVRCRYDEALRSFDGALAIDPNRSELWFLRGTTLSSLHRNDEALASIDRGLSVRPDDHDLWRVRGQVLGGLRRYEEALASFDRALEIRTDDHEAWCLRAGALSDLDRNEDALASLARALAIKPDDQKTLRLHGSTLSVLARFEEAIFSFNRALAVSSPEQGVVSHRLAICLSKFLTRVFQERLDLAQEEWREAVNAAEPLEHRQEALAKALLLVAKRGHVRFVGRLIAESGLEEELFPLARAVEYLVSNDEALIEKLSPEVRGIVEQIVSKLRKSVGHEGP